MALRFCTGLVLAVAIGFAAVGCNSTEGPDMAPVTGMVTMDGQPLAGVVVSFFPQGEGKGSSGTTDAEGKYTLRFNPSLDGALLGMHDVRIVTPTDDNTGKPTGPIVVPKQYNKNTTLTAKVENQENKIDFDLQAN